MAYAVDVTTVPSRTVAVTRFHVDADDIGAMGARMGAAFGKVMAGLGRARIGPAGPPLAFYERSGEGFDVAAGFPVREPFGPVDGISPLELPAAEVAHTTHLGSYEDLPAAYDALRAAVEARGRALADDAPMWEEYWSPPGTPPSQTRTEVYWSVACA